MDSGGSANGQKVVSFLLQSLGGQSDSQRPDQNTDENIDKTTDENSDEYTDNVKQLSLFNWININLITWHNTFDNILLSASSMWIRDNVVFHGVPVAAT